MPPQYEGGVEIMASFSEPQAWRPVGIAPSLPLVGAALLADLVKDSWDKRPGSTTPGNAYRIVARRR